MESLTPAIDIYIYKHIGVGRDCPVCVHKALDLLSLPSGPSLAFASKCKLLHQSAFCYCNKYLDDQHMKRKDSLLCIVLVID